MATKYIRDPGASARRIRAIVESKESFLWPTTMKEIKFIFDVANLGSDIVENILESLDTEGVQCFSGSCEPTQEKKPVILYLKGCEHSGCFTTSGE